MTHISRPFQIFLVAFVLFFAVWFVALRDHTSSTTGAGSSVPAPPPVKTSPAKPAGTSTHATVVRATTTTKPASASGAHTTTTHVTVVKRSTTGRPASAPTRPSTTHSTTAVAAKPSAGKASATKPHTATSAPAKPAPRVAVKPVPSVSAKPAPSAAKHVAGATKPAAGLPPMQVAVEHQLQQNKTVLVLFWNPNGYDDAVVHRELPAVERSSHGSVVVHYASAKQVGEYGAITDAVQVNQTPTLLIVEPHGQTTTITGLTEAFAIDQAIAEARAAAAKTATK